MAQISPTSVEQAGTVAAFDGAAEAGDSVFATGLGTVVVEFRNTSAGSITVTLAAPDVVINDPTYGRLTKADEVMILGAGEDGCFSLARPYGLADEAGRVSFTYSDHEGLKIRAIRA